MTVPIYAVGLVISNLVAFSSDHFQEKVRLSDGRGRSLR
jgi:hypothetical protein